MTEDQLRPPGPRALLCDADGCLVPSEGPAYDASITVTNLLLAELGISTRYTAEEIRRDYLGKNFRTTAQLIAARHGAVVRPHVLERWATLEKRVVSEHLAKTLRPDPDPVEALGLLSEDFILAVVSSSAATRVNACLAAAGQSAYFDPSRRYSAEDSLPRPTSKPDPAIYAHAGAALGVVGAEALAIEDSPVGVTSAVAAGFPAVGMLAYVSTDERPVRDAELRAAGAQAVYSTWGDLAAALSRTDRTATYASSSEMHHRP